MAKHYDVAVKIKEIIGEENIISFTNCMTRLRVKAKPNFNADELKQVSGVLGVVKAGTDEYQIILGPGFVNKVAMEFAKIVNVKKDEFTGENIEQDFQSASQLAAIEKKKIRKNNKIQNFLAKISKVFTPLIPAFIGAGLLSGIAGILESSVAGNFNNHETLLSWNKTLSLLLAVLSNVFIIAAGWRMGEEWGGNPALSALTAAIYCGFAGGSVALIFTHNSGGTYNLLGVHIDNIEKNWFSVGFVNINPKGVASLGAPHAGLIGAMLSSTVTIQIEKLFRKFMPGAIDTIVTPIIVLFIMLLLNLILLIPVAGYLFTGIAWLFKNVYQNPFGAAFLAGTFLIALAFGVHQGFLPVYYALIQDTKVNGLFPIMCMAGVAQVGVSIMLWILAGRGSILRKQISGAIIPGFLGIGEPLIYGISLPRVRPFVVSCFAAAVGGFYLGAINTWAKIGLGMNAATGPGGLTATIMMSTMDGNVVKGILTYLSAVLLTYIIGALFCWFAYSKISLNGSKAVKEVYKKNGNYSKWQKIGLSIAFITILGIFIFQIVKYIKLPIEKKQELKAYKVV